MDYDVVGDVVGDFWKITCPGGNLNRTLFIEYVGVFFIPTKVMSINYHQTVKKVNTTNFIPIGYYYIPNHVKSKFDDLSLVQPITNAASTCHNVLITDPFMVEVVKNIKIIHKTIVALGLKYLDDLNSFNSSELRGQRGKNVRKLTVEYTNARNQRNFEIETFDNISTKLDVLCKKILNNMNDVCDLIVTIMNEIKENLDNGSTKIEKILRKLSYQYEFKNIFNESTSFTKKINDQYPETIMSGFPFDCVFDLIIKEICFVGSISMSTKFGTITNLNTSKIIIFINETIDTIRKVSNRVFDPYHKLSTNFSKKYKLFSNYLK